VEGNCTLQNQVFHADWTCGLGGVRQAHADGKDALDHLQFTSQFSPVRRHYGQNPYASPIDICLWTFSQGSEAAIYRLIGAQKNRVSAYASSQHIATKTPDPMLKSPCR